MPVPHDRRQVVCRQDASPDVLLVDAPLVRRPGGPRRSITRVPPGKHMPGEVSMGEVSMTISPVAPSMDRTVRRLGPAATSVGEGVPTVVLSFTPRSVPTISGPMDSDVPAVPLSVPLGCPTPSSSLTSSGQSATPPPQTLAWGDTDDSSVPFVKAISLDPRRPRIGDEI